MTYFIGIDFEYGNNTAGSICAYGLAFPDGAMEHGFVRLPEACPEQKLTRYHHITQEETDGGISIQEFHKRLAQLAQDYPDLVLVAHDLKSDRRAWLAALKLNSLEGFPLTWVDALPIARESLGINRRGAGGGVRMMADYYGMEIIHHNPAYDALVSLEVVKRNPPTKNFVRDL